MEAHDERRMNAALHLRVSTRTYKRDDDDAKLGD
jgi:hypothetical protein